MASESLSGGVDLFFAQELCVFKQEHGPSSGSKQVKTEVLLTAVLGPLRCQTDTRQFFLIVFTEESLADGF